MKKHYKDIKHSGETLWKAICDEGQGCYNPPLVDDWISRQSEAYMETDWDDDWKEISKACKECNHRQYTKDREDWAYKRASDDFDIFIEDIDEGKDEDVAEFFNIKLEIIGYDKNDGEFVDANDVIGFCNSCENPITKKDLFGYNKGLEREEYDKEDIGVCSYCTEGILYSEIKDEDISLVVSI